MKFLVNTKTLREQLALTEGVVPKNPMIPVLENFLVEISQDNLKVTTSDLQITCITSLPVEAKEEGKMAIPASIFSQTLQNLPEEIITVSFDQESYNIEIQASKGKYKLSSENPNDFPAPPEVENSFHISLSTNLLLQAIKRSAYAMSTDELRPAMNGLLLKIGPDGTIFVVTDGHRLVYYGQHDATHDTAHSLLIPRKAIQMIDKVLKKTTAEKIDIQFNPSQALFQIAGVQIFCRLIDERFPDYDKVLPKENNNHIFVDREEILDSLQRVSIYANKSTNQMRIKVTGEKFAIIVEDLDFSNEATEHITCTHEGEDIEMGFNIKFLIEALQNMEEKQVRLELSEPSRAALAIPIFQENEPSKKNVALVMPIMLNE